MHIIRRIFCLILIALLSFATNAEVYATVPANIQAKIFTKIIRFDRNLLNRAGKELVLTVIYRNDDADSEKDFHRTFGEMKKLEEIKIQNLPVKVGNFSYSSFSELEKIIKKDETDVIYLCDGLESDLKNLSEIAKNKGIITLTDRRDYVEKGVIAGIVIINRKPKMLINLKAAKESNINFDPRFLNLVEIIE